MSVHDVSLRISTELPTWPGDPGVSITLTNSMARGDAANVTRLDLGVHTGTHIDAPLHFEPGGTGVDEISLDILIGPCRVFDVTTLPEKIDRSDLEPLELTQVTRVLFKTRNSEWWRQGERQFQKSFVYLTAEAASYLVQHGVKLVGIDYLSIERFASSDHPTHHALLRHGVVIIEGLDLSGIVAGDYELIALPIKLKDGDGAPTRVVLRELER